ncbi:MAG: alpha/beta hydrolase [Ginsengibacter sp.]
MKHIYCISGLGADERVFSKLAFTGYETHFINWIIPEKNEHINAYVQRLIPQIQHNNPILIGLSFGGMICIEIAKLIPVEKIILISSIQSYHQIPLWMRIAGKLRLNKIFPMRSFKLIEPIENYNLGIKSDEEKKMASLYRKKISPQYSNWAIDNLLNWRNTHIPKNLYHIHGDKDRLFPVKKLRPDYIVNSGGHLMIMNRFDTVNKYIDLILHNPIAE